MYYRLVEEIGGDEAYSLSPENGHEGRNETGGKSDINIQYGARDRWGL